MDHDADDEASPASRTRSNLGPTKQQRLAGVAAVIAVTLVILAGLVAVTWVQVRPWLSDRMSEIGTPGAPSE